MSTKHEVTLARLFFEAAARFYRAEPWHALSDADPLRLDFEVLGDPIYAVVMGGGGETWGLALYAHGEQLIGIYESTESTAADVVAAIFATEREAPAEWNELRRSHHLPIAGPAAVPIPVRHFADDKSGWPDAKELALLVASLDAVTAFVEAHDETLLAGSPCEATLPIAAAPGSVVRVSFPAAFEGYRPGSGGPRPTELTPPGEGGRNPFLEESRQRILASPHAQRILRRLAWSFFRAPGPVPAGSRKNDETEHALARFVEWGVFSIPLPPDNLTLAEREVDQAAPPFTPEERALRNRGTRPRWSIFEVLDVEADVAMDVRDLFEGDRLRLRERVGTRGLEPGNSLIGPIFRHPDGDDWILGSGITAWHESPEVGDAPAERLDAHEMAALLESNLLGASTAWIERLDARQLRSAWEDFRSALADTGTKLPAFGRIQDWIRLAKSPLDVPRRLSDVTWWQPAEVEVFMALIGRAWNLSPRREFKGRSPDDRSADPDADPHE